MNYAVKAGKCFFIRKYFWPQNLAVDMAFGKNFRAEEGNQLFLDGFTLQHPPAQLVAGDDNPSPLFEKIGDGGLAGGDAAGQADDGDSGYAFASSQFGPTPMSTFKGTLSLITPSIFSFTIPLSHSSSAR